MHSEVKLAAGAVAALGIAFFGLFFVLYNIAMSYTTAARAALALSTLPLQTMIVGALLGGFLGRLLGMYREGDPVGFVMAVLGSILLLWIYRRTASSTVV